LKQLRVHCFRIERKAVGNSPQRSGFEEKHGGTHSGRQQSSKHFLRRFDKTRRKTWCKKESGLEERKIKKKPAIEKSKPPTSLTMQTSNDKHSRRQNKDRVPGET